MVLTTWVWVSRTWNGCVQMTSAIVPATVGVTFWWVVLLYDCGVPRVGRVGRVGIVGIIGMVVGGILQSVCTAYLVVLGTDQLP